MKFLFALAAGIAGALCCGENLLPNSSFELGTAGWGVMNEVPKENGKFQALRVRSSKDSVHGASSLELRNPDGGLVVLCSPAVPVAPGEMYTFSVWLKASVPMTAELSFFSPIDGRWHVVSRKVPVSKEWKRCEFVRKIPAGHPEVVVRVQFRSEGTLFADAAQLERGGSASAYSPSAPVEAAVEMPKTWCTAGERNVTFRAVNYGTSAAEIPFSVTARNALTGWKTEKRLAVELGGGKTVEEQIRLPLLNRGAVELGAKWDSGQAIPFRLAVLNALPRGKSDPEREFCVGVNETGVFRNAGTAHNPYQALGIDFAGHLEMLHATGVSVIRLFEYELGRSWVINPERGKFEFEQLNRFLDAVAKSEIVPYICMDTEAFSINPDSKNPRHVAVRNWFMARDGKREKPLNGMKNAIPVSPLMADWNAYIRAFVENARGRVRYYEIMNEPNLRMTAAKYSSYLETAYRTAKQADPQCRIVGICSTEDYGAEADAFTANAAKIGAFAFLDAFSFHPYQAALDSSAVPADRLLDKLNALRTKYRPEVQLWNSELFYIHSVEDAKKHRRTDPQFLRPENLTRRYVIDFGEGVRVSTPLHVWQLFEKHSARMFADPTRFGQKAVPNASAAAQNAFVYFLHGAKPLGRLELPAGVNGYLFRTADGRETAVVWAVENSRGFFLSLPAELKVFDLFGNPLENVSKLLLDERPVYLTGKNLKGFLTASAFQPQEVIAVTGARFRQTGELAVEFQNRTANAVPLVARLKDGGEIRKCTVPADGRASVRFHTENPAPELLWFDGSRQKKRRLNPVSVRKTMFSGEKVRVGEALEFSAEMTPEFLSVAFSVKDRRRGERIPGQPWTGDCLELFLDTAPESGLDRHLPGASVYRLFVVPVSANGLPAELSGSPNLDCGKIRWSLKENGADYSGKIEIPWEAIGCSGPRELGFDIIADDAEGTKRLAYHAWAGDDSNYASRFQFGRIFMESRQK